MGKEHGGKRQEKTEILSDCPHQYEWLTQDVSLIFPDISYAESGWPPRGESGRALRFENGSAGCR